MKLQSVASAVCVCIRLGAVQRRAPCRLWDKVKMRRTRLQFPTLGNDGADGDVDGTPTNTGLLRLPRLRLLDKILRSDAHINCSIINSQSPTLTLAPENIQKYPSLFPKRLSTADRFIVSRNKYNIEAASYLLTKEGNVVDEDEIDVYKELDTLHVKWRKELMHSAMVRETVIPGLGQKEVLHNSRLSSENKLPGTPVTQRKEMWNQDYCKDGMWKSKPRKKPLICNPGLVLDMPTANRNSRFRYRNLIDWSSGNMIAEGIGNKLTIFEVTRPQLGEELKQLNTDKICALKWNNAGDLLVICTLVSAIKLYDFQFNKIIWITTCNKPSGSSLSCYARCLCWSHDDKFIAVGCTQLITIYSTKTGAIINSIVAHIEEVLVIAISFNSQYIVSTSTDKQIRIFTWPSLQPVFDIMYRFPPGELAWNPLDNNVLCIGGGLSDASLSLWDMTTMDVLSYRLVDFFGAVENLAWNKRSGELVVHWSHMDEENYYTIMPVLASIDRIVDQIPLDKESQAHAVLWNADHSQLGVYTDECLYVWNFFGDEYQYRQTCKKQQEPRKYTRHKHFNSIHHIIR